MSIFDTRLSDYSIPELRTRFNEQQRQANSSAPTYGLTIETLDQIRFYKPQAPEATLIFFHGGGFVLGNLDTLERFCCEIAHFANCLVVSVDYPLAPEHPFPAAPESAYASTLSITKHLDCKRLYIGGSSGGATLAIGVASRLPGLFKGQCLLCPLTDTDFNTPSYIENSVGRNLTREHCIWFMSQYAQQSDYQNPLLAPLKMEDVSQMPPTLLITAEWDPLRDEGQAFGAQLKAAQVPCEAICYPRQIHGFFTQPGDTPEKRDVLAKIGEFIR